MGKTKKPPARSAVRAEDTWDLTRVFKSDRAWERAYKELEALIPGFARFRGKLGRSAKTLLAACEYETAFHQLAEKLGVYAYLKASEDVANSAYQGMVARFTYLATRAGEASSFMAPEIQAIPLKRMRELIRDPLLAEYRFPLEKLLRYRKHTLSEKEERLLAMQGEVAGAPSKIFGQLNDADLKFGEVENEDGERVTLTQGSFRALLESPKRSVRKEAFKKFYTAYEAHANTLAATLATSVLQDVYEARVRNHASARDAALFGDNVPPAVYDNLIGAVHANLDTVHRYYEVRKRALRLKEIRVYDSYAPIVKEARVDIPYAEAVETLCDALRPLGAGYVETMRRGLLQERWVDRYENEGKRSGAFSYGAYGCPPYILMNYKSEVIDSMFTLAHEAGHSMHTHLSALHQPYPTAHYTIFVAEVASTFNEQLLNHFLLGQARTRRERIRLLCREIDEIRGTIVRQTMFAEFEKITHAIAEAGEPLTVDRLRMEYQGLLDRYFGPGVALDPELSLECLRIPHFYSAFYVYKYATGLSAAIALARSVLEEGATARERYLRFLGSGGSKFPLALLRDAGVDMEAPAPVNKAMAHFGALVDELDRLV